MQVSVNDFVIRAVALALAEVPEANAIWNASAGEAQTQGSVDIAIAVATDKGLITPIIRAANTKSLTQVLPSSRSPTPKMPVAVQFEACHDMAWHVVGAQGRNFGRKAGV